MNEFTKKFATQIATFKQNDTLKKTSKEGADAELVEMVINTFLPFEEYIATIITTTS